MNGRPARDLAHEYPTVEVCHELQEQTYKLKAGIVRGLSHPVVLGQDLLILPELVWSTLPVSMVATRQLSDKDRYPEAVRDDAIQPRGDQFSREV